MTGKRALDALLATLCAAACSASVGINLALAGVEDSRFEFSPDGANVEFDVRDAARRDVLNQLFAGSDLEIVWINAAFAEERMGGMFTGTPGAVARQLLAQTNFVVVHDARGDTSRAVRLLVVGPAQGEQSSAGLAALIAAIKPASKPKDPAKPQSVAGAPSRREPARESKPQLTVDARMAATDRKSAPIGAALADAMKQSPPLAAAPLVQSDTAPGHDVAGPLKPPPADASAPLPVLTGGAEAPRLAVPSQTLTAMPLTPAAAGTQAPALRPVTIGRGGI